MNEDNHTEWLKRFKNQGIIDIQEIARIKNVTPKDAIALVAIECAGDYLKTLKGDK